MPKMSSHSKHPGVRRVLGAGTEKREQVARTRKLSPAERGSIVRRRRETGRGLMERQLSGAAVVVATVRPNQPAGSPRSNSGADAWGYETGVTLSFIVQGISTEIAETLPYPIRQV